MNKYTVNLSPSFVRMLKYTLNYYKYYNQNYYNKVKQKVYESISLLQTFPFIATYLSIKGMPNSLRKFIIYKKFLIIFEIIGKDINFLYFTNGTNSYNNYFKY